MSFDPISIQIKFAADQALALEIDERQLALDFHPDEPDENAVESIRKAFETPIDFPPLAQIVIPDDNVILAIDHTMPQLALVVQEVWNLLSRNGISPEQLKIIQTAAEDSDDPRELLPADAKEQILWLRHRPSDEDVCGYLATSTAGERIYLARELLDADVVIAIGCIGFDPLLGYKGTSSVFYPSLSNADAVKKSLGQGHTELEPDNVRPLRQLADETGWLLGTQFSIQTVGNHRNQFSHLLAGATDTVFRAGRELLDEGWRAQNDHRSEIVVASVDVANATWSQVGAALAAARNLVTRGGWIVILSDLANEGDLGMKMIKAADDPEDAMKPIRLELPADVIPATELINALNWGRVFLLSRLNPDFVEDLFCAPLQSVEEVERLLHSADSSISFIRSAQNVHGEIVEFEDDEW